MNYISFFIISSIFTFLLMKLISYIFSEAELKDTKLGAFMFSPYISLSDFVKSKKLAISQQEILFNLLFSLFALVLFHNYLQILINEFSFISIIKKQLLFGYYFFYTLFIGANIQAISILFKSATLPIHRSPFRANSLEDFWLKSWNLWFLNWSMNISEKLFPSSKKRSELVTFLILGFIHELLVNIPYYLYFNKPLFGSMIFYFLIQYYAILLERSKKPIKNLTLKRIIAFLIILLPAPFLINDGLLRFWGF